LHLYCAILRSVVTNPQPQQPQKFRSPKYFATNNSGKSGKPGKIRQGLFVGPTQAKSRDRFFLPARRWRGSCHRNTKSLMAAAASSGDRPIEHRRYDGSP
jgi:hypothetical protein